MIERPGSGSVPLTTGSGSREAQKHTDPDPDGPKTYESGSSTMVKIIKKCTLSMLFDRNANPDSVKNSRYESGSKWLANNEGFSCFKSWIFSIEGYSLKYYSRRSKEENITALNVEILLSYSR
jgi:hypothetical protein